MEIEPEPALTEFRAEVAHFLATAPTPEIREAGRKTTSVFGDFEQVMTWHRILHARGWSAPNWPVQHGGPGWSVAQRYIFAEEYQRSGLPPLLPNGLNMVGPLLMELGTPEQQSVYLPKILSGEDYWAQGYSESGAGSDLASLSTSAVAEGDAYVLNGSKIWTTYAHHANRMFMLVRTSREGRKQQGITFLLLDRMDYPGIAVRPIVGLDGSAEMCEVHFTDVRVPMSGRVGEENDGWSVAKQLLDHERGGLTQSAMLRRRLEVVRTVAAVTPSAFGDPLSDDAVFQREVGELEAEVASFEHFEKLVISGHPVADDPACPSLNKVITSELTQDIAKLMTRVVGLDGLPDQRDSLRVGSETAPLGGDLALIAMPYYLNSRATSIYAGANEVQRDLIARSMRP